MDETHAQTPGEGRTDRLIRLRSQGLSVSEAARLADVSTRQAYRILKRSAPDPELTERWSPSDAMNESPERVNYLFSTMAEGRWTRQEADIAWSIHCANRELAPALVSGFCRLYIVAERSADPELAKRRKLVIDWVLLYEPWRDEELRLFLDHVPILSKEEISYAAAVIHYLRRFVPVEPDGDSERVFLQAALDVDRYEFFRSETVRIERREQGRINSTPKGFLAATEVPGEQSRRGRPLGSGNRKRRAGRPAGPQGDE